MKRRPRKEKLVTDINITPFTDVILVLLVIFMITTPFINERGIKVKLPEATSGKAIDQKAEPVSITITKDGRIFVEKKAFNKKGLKDKIALMKKNDPSLSIVLRSDRDVKFKEVVEVLDILTSLGITKLNIASDLKKEE